VDEFTLITELVKHLGSRAQGRWVQLGPGDDAAVIQATPGYDLVASIDTLLGDVHFPVEARPFDIGYRGMMVSLSDLAAMGAEPRYVLAALTLPEADVHWVTQLAQGMAEAAADCDTYLCGGNLTRGPLSMTVSVHGQLPAGEGVLRSGAQVGDHIYVSGPLGGAAACVRREDWWYTHELSPIQRCFFRPVARFDLVHQLRRCARAAIDISDGLLADLAHICDASQVAARIDSAHIPLVEGAGLEDALSGGDDYQLLCTTAADMADWTCIGEIAAGEGIWLDNQRVTAQGYNHFGAIA